MGSRTLDHMLRSGRFALVGGSDALKGALSAPEPINARVSQDLRSEQPLALSPVAEAFPSSQTWPPDAKSPKSLGARNWQLQLSLLLFAMPA